jgi:hypothetical protein
VSWIQSTFVEWAWTLNCFGIALILTTKFLSNTKLSWFGIGCILLVIGLGNASILLTVGLNPSQQMASVFGLVVLGSLGARFVGNWLTDGAA